MSNIERYECSPDSDDPSDRHLALFGEMLGTTFSRSNEHDPVTGIETGWTYRGDGLYYAREDIDPSGELRRLIRDDQKAGSHDNTITEKRGNDTVSIGYVESSPVIDNPDRFDVKIKALRDRKNVGFVASYLPDGTLRSFEIMALKDEEPAIEEIPDSLPEEVRLDKKLGEIINLYRLKGKAVFDPMLQSDLSGGIDLSGPVPRFVLGDILSTKGYTNEDIEAVNDLASLPVAYHHEYTKLFDDISPVDQGVIREFLTAVTAASLIPSLVHKDDRNLFPKYEDIDPTTVEGLQLMLEHYDAALDQFIMSYNRHIVSTGMHSAAFSPFLGEAGVYVFTIQKAGSHGREILHEDILEKGQEIRHDRSVYAVSESNDRYSLSVRNIFSPNKDEDDYVVVAPLALDAETLRQVMDAEDTSWRESFSYVPVRFKIT